MRKLLLLATLTLSACVTNDFKVVDALQVGMSPEQAQSTIASFGFERKEVRQRPADGWPETEAGRPMSVRAFHAEKELGQRIEAIEYYPVYHGLLGFGELYLFYDENQHLAKFYRYQIN